LPGFDRAGFEEGNIEGARVVSGPESGTAEDSGLRISDGREDDLSKPKPSEGVGNQVTGPTDGDCVNNGTEVEIEVRFMEGAAVLSVSGKYEGVWARTSEGADVPPDGDSFEAAGALLAEGNVPGEASDDVGVLVLPVPGLPEGTETSTGAESFEGTIVSDGANPVSGSDVVRRVGA